LLRFRILIAILAAPFASGCGDDGCENSVLQDLPSPDGHRHAIVFARSCGATNGISTQVSIVPSIREAHGGGNVFIADTDHGKAAIGPSGGPVIAARWIDPRTLEIRYPSAARILRRDARHDDTDIRYAVDSTSVSRP
jgi:hypothetical protein